MNDLPETGQTGQKDEERGGRVEVQYEAGLWNWVFKAPNGRVMIQGAEHYQRRNDCTRAISAAIKQMRGKITVYISHEEIAEEEE